jgi:hypothetical protein
MVVVALGACSSDDPLASIDDDVTVPPDPAVVADSTLTDPAEYATNGQPIEEEPGFVLADANTATSAELVAAFQANGIANGATWAAEVIGHRPYAAGEAGGSQFDGLRAALAEAGLDDFAIEAIVASLEVTR